MTASEAGALWVGIVLGVTMGAVMALLITLYQSPIVAQFAELDCYIIKDEFEPWHTVADGQVLHVGNRKYLAVTREQRNSNLRYDGYRTYGFEVNIVDADKAWQKTVCPQVWMR